MGYRVIKYFTDLQDNDRPYNVGDTFPRDGLSVSPARYKELAGANNKQGTPLIEKIPDAAPVDDDIATLETQEESRPQRHRKGRKEE